MDAPHVNTGYLASINSNAVRCRMQRKQRKRRQALAKIKISISSQPNPRTLKPSVRRRLEKERTRKLWILPDNIDLTTDAESRYPRATLLGLPAELRQKVLLMSYDAREMARQELIGTSLWKRLSAKSKNFRTNMFGSSLSALTAQEQNILSKLSNRVVELSQVSKILWRDMRYVRKYWQRQIETILRRKVELDALEIPVSAVPQGFVFRRKREQSVVVEGDDRPLRGRRPGKCWYCTERHAPGESGCPRANEDPEMWIRETRAVGGWRSRAELKSGFEATKVIFDD